MTTTPLRFPELSTFTARFQLDDLPPGDDPTSTVNALLGLVAATDAQGLHLEARPDGGWLGLRARGQVLALTRVPGDARAALTRAIKAMSCLDLDEGSLPQDGRIHLRLGGVRRAATVSVAPTRWGERVVVQLVPEGQRAPLEALGLSASDRDRVRAGLGRARGLVLLTAADAATRRRGVDLLAAEALRAGGNVAASGDGTACQLAEVPSLRLDPRRGLTEVAGLRSLARGDADLVVLDAPRDEDCLRELPRVIEGGQLVLLALPDRDLAAGLRRLWAADAARGASWLADEWVLGLALAGLRGRCVRCRGADAPASPTDAAAPDPGCPACLGTGAGDPVLVASLRAGDAWLRDALGRPQLPALRGGGTRRDLRRLAQARVAAGAVDPEEVDRVLPPS